MKRRRLLVVDDDRDTAHSLAMLLRTMGHEATYVDEPVKALEVAKAFRPQVAFIDLWMPVVDGYMVARILKSAPELQGLHLVALTGLGRPEDHARSRQAGFDLNVRKPLDVPLLEWILAQLDGR